MNFSIIANEVKISATRSRGPGGQNVNKVSSAAQLFWNYLESQGLNQSERLTISQKLGNIINREDQIFLRADEFRDLERNKARALEKLEQILKKALHRPKVRRATKPTRASRERKLAGKAHRGEIKKNRGKVNWGD